MQKPDTTNFTINDMIDIFAALEVPVVILDEQGAFEAAKRPGEPLDYEEPRYER